MLVFNYTIILGKLNMKKIIIIAMISMVSTSAFAGGAERVDFESRCKESAEMTVKSYNTNNEIKVISSEGTQRGNQYEVRMVYSRSDNLLKTAYSCSFEKIRDQWVITSTNSYSVK